MWYLERKLDLSFLINLSFCCGCEDNHSLKYLSTNSRSIDFIFLLHRHEIININLKDKPDWFLEKNPSGTVPVLETSSGQVIYESPITCDYLDEVYPEKKLLPSDPFERAQQKMLLDHYSKVGNLSFGNMLCIFTVFWIKWIYAYIFVNSSSFQVVPYFYKISMGKERGEDVSAAEVEFTEKVSQLNEVSCNS